jgi:hypothetical protein
VYDLEGEEGAVVVLQMEVGLKEGEGPHELVAKEVLGEVLAEHLVGRSVVVGPFAQAELVLRCCSEQGAEELPG